MRHTFHRSILLLAVVVALAGCQQGQKGARNPRVAPPRDPALARQHILAGIEFLEEGDLELAEAAFNQAIEADVLSGVAHNNLGKVYYLQDRLYQAAWQFQHANKLMPGSPEPRNNLGLTLEAAGKLEGAIEQYELAVAREPDDPVVLGNLVRARLRRGDSGPEMTELVRDYVMKESRPEWLTWARRRLALLEAKGGSVQ